MSDERAPEAVEPKAQILELRKGQAQVRVGENPLPITLFPREEGVYDLKTERGWTRAYVARTEKGIWWVHHEGQVFEFDRSRRATDDSEASDGANGRVRAPTPAKVAAVLVQEGATVGEEDAVVVLEAMKTEQTLLAGVAGTVAQINVEEGQQVGLDDLLVIIEPDEKPSEDAP